MTGKYENAERILVGVKLRLLKNITNDEAVYIIKMCHTFDDPTYYERELDFYVNYHKNLINYMYERAKLLVNTKWEDLDVNSPTLAIVETALTQPKRFKFKNLHSGYHHLTLEVLDNKTKADFTVEGYNSGRGLLLDDNGTFSLTERYILGEVLLRCHNEKKQRVNTYLEKRKERKKSVERAKLIALYEV